MKIIIHYFLLFVALVATTGCDKDDNYYPAPESREIRRLNILKRMSISIRGFLRKIPIQILFTPIFVCAMPVTTKFTSLLRFARQKR